MSFVHVKDDLSSSKVTNIFGTSDMTRSGQIFTAPELLVWSKDPRGKAKVDVGESDKAGLTPNDEVPVEEVTEFLRMTTSTRKEYPLRKQPSS